MVRTPHCLWGDKSSILLLSELNLVISGGMSALFFEVSLFLEGPVSMVPNTAIVYLLMYIGAIAILFLFIIILLDAQDLWVGIAFVVQVVPVLFLIWSCLYMDLDPIFLGGNFWLIVWPAALVIEEDLLRRLGFYPPRYGGHGPRTLYDYWYYGQISNKDMPKLGRRNKGQLPSVSGLSKSDLEALIAQPIVDTWVTEPDYLAHLTAIADRKVYKRALKKLR